MSTSDVAEKSFKDTMHNERSEYESEQVNTEECTVRDHLINCAENRQRTIKVRADIEHVEGLVDTVDKERAVDNNVKNDSDNTHYAKDLYTTEEMLDSKSVSVSYRIENTQNDLRAVVHHCLYTDACGRCKYVAGIKHNCKTGKEREGHHIRDARVTELFTLGKRDYRQDIQGRGAELEGEYIPGVIHVERAVCNMEYVQGLLIYLKNENHHPYNGGQDVHCSVRGILKEPAHKDGEDSYPD